MHPLVQLAKRAVEIYVTERRILPRPREMTPEMLARAGVFVCLKKFEELRGCIGTFEPTEQTVAEEIIRNAISSATRDPRFPPVRSDELRFISYGVDVLGPYEVVEDLEQLDAKRYGVIVQGGGRRGLLLPDLEGVDTALEQIEIARRKAGITAGDHVAVFRFEVVRYA
ncbi:MAG: AmmeMemoRadiSam system protein A [Chloroflexi bacterium]|nr:AmmeMemoRadiSam system protein A [Chloroflexota bacterium]